MYLICCTSLLGIIIPILMYFTDLVQSSKKLQQLQFFFYITLQPYSNLYYLPYDKPKHINQNWVNWHVKSRGQKSQVYNYKL